MSSESSSTTQTTTPSASRSRWVQRGLGILSASLVTGFCFYLLFGYLVPSPKEALMAQELEEVVNHYAQIERDVMHLEQVLDNMKDRDAAVYELMLGMTPVEDHVWQGGIGGHDLDGEERMGDISLRRLESRLDDLSRKLVLQSKQIDQAETRAEDRDLYQRCVPSIRPIKMKQNDTYIRLLSGYGMRLHPVHKVNKMHYGLDFPAPKGTPIIATGDGKVIKVSRSRTGYGRSVVVDHGFGYSSLYAHLDKCMVRKGQTVKRGEQIGTVGRTGTATACHVHYEVRKDNKPVNPIHYCMDGLTTEEYQVLVESACKHNHSFD